MTEPLEAIPRRWKAIRTVRKKFTCRIPGTRRRDAPAGPRAAPSSPVPPERAVQERRRPEQATPQSPEAPRAAPGAPGRAPPPCRTAAAALPPTAQAGVPLRPTIPRRGPSRRRRARDDARSECGARRHCLLCRSTPGPRWRLGSPGPPRGAPSMEVGRTGRVGSGVRGVHYFRAEGRGDGRRRRA